MAEIKAPSFREWFNGMDNPLRNASDLAKHYTADALRLAFEAGQRYEKRLADERKELARQRRKQEETFTFE